MNKTNAALLVAFAKLAQADDHGSDPGGATAVAIGNVTLGVIDVDRDVDYFKCPVATTGT